MQKKTGKKDLLSLLQDETFVQQVRNATNPDELLAELIRENPDCIDSIRHAFEFIIFNRTNTTMMDPEDFNRNLNIPE